jgi:hypothetical protein
MQSLAEKAGPGDAIKHLPRKSTFSNGLTDALFSAAMVGEQSVLTQAILTAGDAQRAAA